MADNHESDRPLVLITGANGNIGRSLADALRGDYRVVGLDNDVEGATIEIFEVDITSSDSIGRALGKIGERHGRRIAAVIHLIAFFDFSGEENPLYDKVNVEGTRLLIEGLADGFEVECFIYSGTMLVHEPAEPGGVVTEDTPFDPRWAYPKSKLATEEVIRSEAEMPYAILRLAGVYDEDSAVPTLAHQIARIYERDLQSHLYSGPLEAGQSMLHRDDMIDAFLRAVDRRKELPRHAEILVGEPEAVGYDDLQDRIGCLIHGAGDWETVRVPKPIAKAGAAAQQAAEPLIPDAIDHGEKPFIRPFMIDMADDHYALDISRAQRLLGWRPKHRLQDVLPALIAGLKADPAKWYERNGLTAPAWIEHAGKEGGAAETLRREVDERRIALHRQYRWPHFANIALGLWLLTQPPLIGLEPALYSAAEIAAGAALIVCATLSLSWRLAWARWLCAGFGLAVMALPMLFITPNAAAYLSDTLVGALIFAFAVGTPPEVGPDVAARSPAPEVPPGWSYNPSSWAQRLPIILLAIFGLLFSRYLAAYQMGHVEGVWEPFFAGSAADPRNGTEEIITSSVSEAWPVPDAALGAYVYMLEILTGTVGGRTRWRTMPWLVLAFGLLIVPLGIVSIGFIIIQPIVIGTWSTLALIGAAAMLVQIPYSIDELAASLSFLGRRRKAGDSVLRALLFGGPDEGEAMTEPHHEFARPPLAVLRDMWAGAVNLPWTLWLAGAIGASFMLTRLTLGAEGMMAHADHLLGALVLTVLAVAAAEVTRAARFALVPLGMAMAAAPFVFGGSPAHIAVSLVGGAAIAALCFPRGRIVERYGTLDRLIR